MSYSASIVPVKKGEILSPGFLVHGDAPAPHGAPDVAVVLRVFEHRGAIALDNDRLQFHGGLRESWVGWYSKSVLDNGWAPYDQPHWAAYIPRGEVERLLLPDGSALVRSPVRAEGGAPRRSGFYAARFGSPGLAMKHIQAAISHVSRLTFETDRRTFLVQPRIVIGTRVKMGTRINRRLLSEGVPVNHGEGVVLDLLRATGIRPMFVGSPMACGAFAKLPS